MKGYEIIDDDSKFVIHHDGEPIAWFRYFTDVHIFMEALGAPLPDGEYRAGKPSVPDQMFEHVVNSPSVPFRHNPDDYPPVDDEHPFAGWTEAKP